ARGRSEAVPQYYGPPAPPFQAQSPVHDKPQQV
ncbi:hypothetical protein CMV_030629, partial [Castanea mollissima]